eukprot:Gregarina_sp_Poly_1__9365@NODE_583_length_7383_cov_511_461318_g452_i0_p1_GENE_NODE_583_length_7383_cov_511_461318_g452_i0NODE_583_length_7383_cov_511_461318_g452_i0_p1_ORF_typecomplete_len1075_score214_45_NODE_583_length_7383_cov_511_461318_g452_i014164640
MESHPQTPVASLAKQPDSQTPDTTVPVEIDTLETPISELPLNTPGSSETQTGQPPSDTRNADTDNSEPVFVVHSKALHDDPTVTSLQLPATLLPTSQEWATQKAMEEAVVHVHDDNSFSVPTEPEDESLGRVALQPGISSTIAEAPSTPQRSEQFSNAAQAETPASAPAMNGGLPSAGWASHSYGSPTSDIALSAHETLISQETPSLREATFVSHEISHETPNDTVNETPSPDRSIVTNEPGSFDNAAPSPLDNSGADQVNLAASKSTYEKDTRLETTPCELLDAPVDTTAESTVRGTLMEMNLELTSTSAAQTPNINPETTAVPGNLVSEKMVVIPATQGTEIPEETLSASNLRVAENIQQVSETPISESETGDAARDSALADAVPVLETKADASNETKTDQLREALVSESNVNDTTQEATPIQAGSTLEMKTAGGGESDPLLENRVSEPNVESADEPISIAQLSGLKAEGDQEVVAQSDTQPGGGAQETDLVHETLVVETKEGSDAGSSLVSERLLEEGKAGHAVEGAVPGQEALIVETKADGSIQESPPVVQSPVLVTSVLETAALETPIPENKAEGVVGKESPADGVPVLKTEKEGTKEMNETSIEHVDVLAPIPVLKPGANERMTGPSRPKGLDVADNDTSSTLKEITDHMDIVEFECTMKPGAGEDPITMAVPIAPGRMEFETPTVKIVRGTSLRTDDSARAAFRKKRQASVFTSKPAQSRADASAMKDVSTPIGAVVYTSTPATAAVAASALRPTVSPRTSQSVFASRAVQSMADASALLPASPRSQRTIFESAAQPSRADVTAASPVPLLASKSVFESAASPSRSDASATVAPLSARAQRALFQSQASPSNADAVAGAPVAHVQKRAVFTSAASPSVASVRHSDAPPPPSDLAAVYESQAAPSIAHARAGDSSPRLDPNPVTTFISTPLPSQADVKATDPVKTLARGASGMFVNSPEPSTSETKWDQAVSPKQERTVFESSPKIERAADITWKDKPAPAPGPIVFENVPQKSTADTAALRDLEEESDDDEPEIFEQSSTEASPLPDNRSSGSEFQNPATLADEVLN